MNERRQAPRINAETNILVKIQSAPAARYLEGKSLPANSTDISLGGLCMQVVLPIPVGALLELKITFQDSSERFWLTGIVVWNNPRTSTVGIRFNMADNPQLNAWKQAISRLLHAS